MNNALSIVGSSRLNGEREENDFYPTPAFATEELLKREKFDGVMWECACGDGAISKVCIQNGYEVISTDLIDRDYGDQENFLLSDRKVSNIITNPPYKDALSFVLNAKRCADKKIAMFLKTVFLEGDGRYTMFQDTEFPLKCIYQFSRRVSLTKNGEKMKNSGMLAFAWFVWDKDWKGTPEIKWIR
jgi:hypothetical protein